MENDREQKERERLQKEAEEERKKIDYPPVYFDGIEFDVSDPETRLICKVPPQTLVWTSPEQKTVHVIELYWRTKDGNYFKFTYDEDAGMPFHIDVEEAHYIMNKRTDYEWFLNDAQKKELKEADERIKLEKRSSLR